MSKRAISYEVDGVLGKVCTKCSEWQPFENFNKRSSSTDGKNSHCKECCRKGKGAKKRILRTSLTEVDGVVGKECGLCRKWKPLDDFGNRQKSLGGKRSDCIICERERNLQYSRDHKEECRRREQEWSKRNPDKRLAKLRRWYANNPDKATANNHRRLARKRSLPDTFNADDVRAGLEIFGGCALTGDSDIHWDHVVPLATGRVGTVRGNMVPLRKDLNVSKSDGNIFEWFERNSSRFNLSKEKFDNLIKVLSDMNGMSVEDYRSFVYECFENKQEVI